MIDQVLRLLEKGLVLRLEHFELFQGIVADFFEFLLILSINLLLNGPPVIVGELLFIVKWVQQGHLVRERSGLGLDCIGSLIDALGRWHGSDSWIHLLGSFALREVGLHHFWLHVVFLGKSVTSDDGSWLSVTLLSGHGALIEVSAIAEIGLGRLLIVNLLRRDILHRSLDVDLLDRHILDDLRLHVLDRLLLFVVQWLILRHDLHNLVWHLLRDDWLGDGLRWRSALHHWHSLDWHWLLHDLLRSGSVNWLLDGIRIVPLLIHILFLRFKL